MARSGVPSKVGAAGGSDETRQALIQAAVDVLRTDGFHGASARKIAARAGCNQGLVFYHFGSVANLLLAALDAVSEDRLARYSEAVAGTSSVVGLADVAAAIFEEDLDSGYAKVLVELIAGSASVPGMGAEVSRRIAEWTGFARSAIEGTVSSSLLAAVAPPSEVAYGVVAMYLGLEMLSHLDDDRAQAHALFQRARTLAVLAGAFGFGAGAFGFGAGTSDDGSSGDGTPEEEDDGGDSPNPRNPRPEPA
ncbi:TetR/AcrR family transcriptional regulator [Actinacidiphila acidipaludis]|uniref:TetR/AcrR family transcriptional regulator n=1 Tax=Actinacidiphila acidipaludis TaxID=2873382 RepID=A0ABS7Q1M7_9ACTN|nr:TetR/AcrR family transcriptional regulator [Streptomyces acidipaludis]MBY8877032.1 TetR/AcrR family transcriptional regulator [Streptomyces acidipaludis]